jgi:hypothetical protein
MATNQHFQNQIKKKSGFCSFTEEEFDVYLAKLVEEDMGLLLALGRN